MAVTNLCPDREDQILGSLGVEVWVSRYMLLKLLSLASPYRYPFITNTDMVGPYVA